ncbi:MAG TPA: S8 family serine peptidase, partial [Acidimicrobiales bacterium]|nr:S8 family serine peptidase [Acidimicrobiales bacterium]
SDSTRPFYPAALKHLDIAAVGAVEEVPPVDGDLPHSNEIVRVPGQQDRYARAWFSNHGDWVTCSAPGVDIVSTYQWGYYRPLDGGPLRSFNGGARWSGTSFAAPRVAGAVAARMQSDGLDNPHEAFARLIAEAPAGPPGLGKLIL